VDRFRRELEYLDFARRIERVEAIGQFNNRFALRTASGAELIARTIILATGSRVKYLNVPGERDYMGRGLSYSAISYAPLFIGRHATVVGDGILALRAVAELAQVASTVHLIAPSHGTLSMPLAQKLLADPMKIVVMEGYTVKAIQGKEFAEQVIVKSPEGQESKIDTDGIFVELGLLPNSDLVKGLTNLDNQGRVIIDKRNRTSCLGLFAAGDVTDAYAEQVLIAVGEGAKAALSAYEYLLSML
jgi:thioredoxin reductase